MVEYSCEKCGKSFGNLKSHYERHINKKFQCKQIINIQFLNQSVPKLNQIVPNYTENNNKVYIQSNQCDFCHKTFSAKSSLTRHQNSRCKEIIKQNTEKEQINKLIELNELLIKQNEENKKQNEENNKKIEELQNQLVQVQKSKGKANKSKVNISNSNNNSNNTTNINNNINIQINKYGTEDYDNLDNKLFLEPMLKEIGKQIFLKQIQNVYINPDLPQNHNIVITDKNRQICKVHDGVRWKTTDIKIINELLGRIIEHSKVKYEEYSTKYNSNNKIKNKLDISKKYIDRCDPDHLATLEEEQANDEADNRDEIARCKDFYEMVYKDTINLLHDYKDIIVK